MLVVEWCGVQERRRDEEGNVEGYIVGEFTPVGSAWPKVQPCSTADSERLECPGRTLQSRCVAEKIFSKLTQDPPSPYASYIYYRIAYLTISTHEQEQDYRRIQSVT